LELVRGVLDLVLAMEEHMEVVLVLEVLEA